MDKLTIEEMDNLVKQTTNHKVLALLKKYKSIELFPTFQRDLVATHFGYKVVKRTDITYTNGSTGLKISYREVEEAVRKSAESNYKIDLLLKTKSSFSKLTIPQKKLILDYLGITIERERVFHFKKTEG